MCAFAVNERKAVAPYPLFMRAFWALSIAATLAAACLGTIEDGTQAAFAEPSPAVSADAGPDPMNAELGRPGQPSPPAAFNPDAVQPDQRPTRLPADVEEGLPDTLGSTDEGGDGPAAKRFIFVAASAAPAAGVGTPRDDNGPADSYEGARSAPMESIQAALAAASGGTAIVVQGGTEEDPIVYPGTVTVREEHTATATADAPIWLVAETYRGALIRGDRGGAGLVMRRARHLHLHNFQIEAVESERASVLHVLGVQDEPPVDVGHLVIAGNTFFGSAVDCVKVTTSMDVKLYGNFFDGGPRSRFSESAMDFVTVFESDVSFNTVRGHFPRHGFRPKAGSMHLLFEGNDVRVEETVAAGFGGVGASRVSRPMPFAGWEWEWAEAHDVVARNNRFVSTGPRAVDFTGARDVLLEANLIQSSRVAVSSRSARSGGWRDQPDRPPAEHTDSVVVTPQNSRPFLYLSRSNVIQSNYFAAPTLHQAEGDTRLSSYAVRGNERREVLNANDLLPGPLGVTGWDATAVYRHLGLR